MTPGFWWVLAACAVVAAVILAYHVGVAVGRDRERWEEQLRRATRLWLENRDRERGAS